MYKPIFITEENISLLGNVINGKSKCSLPIVYVSKMENNTDPVRVDWLAQRLKGIAHVLVQSDVNLNQKCFELCNEKNEYYGGIGVYYPNATRGHISFLCYQDDKDGVALFRQVVRNILHYSSTQNITNMYIWQGVKNAILTDKLASQHEKRLMAEQKVQDTCEETESLLKAYDVETAIRDTQIAELKAENEKLRNEAQWLHKKLNASGNAPLLYYGEEKEFYPGEIKDLILAVLDEHLKTHEKHYKRGNERCRREDVCYDIIKANDYQHISEKKKTMVKNTLAGYKNMTSSLRQKLKEVGIEIEEDGRHHRLTYYSDARYQTTISKTAGDVKVGDNAVAAISGIML